MTLESFIGQVQAYYGASYPKAQLPYIVQYLKPLNDRALDHLFAECLKAYSSRWGKAPDIEVFESLRKDVRDALEQEVSVQNLSRIAIEDTTGFVEFNADQFIKGLIDAKRVEATR